MAVQSGGGSGTEPEEEERPSATSGGVWRGIPGENAATPVQPVSAPASRGGMSPAQIAKVAYDAGFRGQALVTAVAVALAESRGNPAAHNPNGEDSRGLWQINVDPSTSWGRERAKKYGDLFDPVTNARAAFEISQGGENFQPWTTFSGASSSGAANSHSKFLDDAQQGVQQLASGVDIEVPTGGGSPAGGQGGDVIAAAAGEITPVGGSLDVGGISVPQVPDEIANLEDDELRDYLEKNYGYLAWALSIPQVGDILLDVARGNVTDPDKLFGQLYETDWWQGTSAAVRQWDSFVGQDPATAKEQVRATQQQLKLYASRLGVSVEENRLWQMARDALRFGWVQPGQSIEQSSQVRNALFAEAKRATVSPEQASAGDAGALEQGYDAVYARVKKAFENRSVPIAWEEETEEQRLDRITRSLLDGSRTWDSVRASLDAQRPLEPGILTATADTLKALADDFLIPLSDHAARDWSERIARGETTQEAFRSYLQQQATSLFSGNAAIAQALESGMSVRQWADPYVQMAAQTLELNPTDVDLNDPRFMEAIHQVDPESGGGSPMGLGEFQRYLRGLPEWRTTKNAVSSASDMVEFLGERMGAV